jgi:hypothetical protein
MTQIISIITPLYVAQLSDRRVIDVRSGGVISDRWNKAVQLENSALFAYCGVAELEGAHVDEWITEHLPTNVDLAQVLDGLAALATTAVSALAVRARMRKLCISAVGFANLDGAPPLRPWHATVSNFRDKKGGWLPEAQPEFSVFFVGVEEGFCRQNNTKVFLSGARTEHPQVPMLERCARHALRNNSSPTAVLPLAWKIMRSIARSTTTVGQETLWMSLPVASAESNSVAMGGVNRDRMSQESKSRPVFLALDSPGERPRVMMPCLVSENLRVRGGFVEANRATR